MGGDGKCRWEQLGRYEVRDRHEMSRIVKEAAETYGAVLTGISLINSMWIYSRDIHQRPLSIPEDYRYVIVMAVPMDKKAIRTSPSLLSATATGVGYSHMAFTTACMAEFIRDLGYRAIAMGNDTALSIPLAMEAGLGRIGRNGLLITEDFGPCVRICKIFTDLTLEPDTPLEPPFHEGCYDCRMCADACEADAIQNEKDPSFRTLCPSNSHGVRRWAVNQDLCYGYWLENGACCSTCIAVCPFAN